jgi:hypothetical protein
MANGNLAGTRLRRASRPNGLKGRSRTKKVSVRRVPKKFPPELHAPITGKIEHQLKQLRFSEKKVRKAPDPLITKM